MLKIKSNKKNERRDRGKTALQEYEQEKREEQTTESKCGWLREDWMIATIAAGHADERNPPKLQHLATRIGHARAAVPAPQLPYKSYSHYS